MAHGVQTGSKLLRKVSVPGAGNSPAYRTKPPRRASPDVGFGGEALCVLAQRDSVGPGGRRCRSAAGLEFAKPGLYR
jgi:hypothetical protein